jgi:hypothetical protein
MLHRRTTSTAPSAGQNTNIPSNTNNTYTPLRRPSQQLYNTPTQSAPKARYALPSPSLNYLSPGNGPAGYTQRQSIDLGDEGMDIRVEGWGKVVRSGMDRFKMGLRDGLKLDRSLTLVWGWVSLHRLGL